MIYKNLFFLLIFPLFMTCHAKRGNNDLPALKHITPQMYAGPLDSFINESSGLIIWDKYFWTFNDSGGRNELYGLDLKNGKTRIVLQLKNAHNEDWEDITQDKKYIYVAETGNNGGNRKDLKVYRVRKNTISGEELQSTEVDSIMFDFADQKDFNVNFRHTSYDCEAIMAYHDSLFVFTKDWLHYKTKMYGFPSEPGNYSVMPMDSFNVDMMVTGADILHDGRFALIGYKDYHSYIWLFRKENNKNWGKPRHIELSKLQDAQTEGICFSKTGDIFISNERTAHFAQQIWRIPAKDIPW